MPPVPAPPDPAHAFELLTPDHGPELRALFQGCADYVRMSEGREPSDAQLEDLFGNVPPGRSAADKAVFGVRRADGRLVGAVELLRAFPEPRDCFLGLQVLLPEVRGAGLGDRVFRAAEAWARGEGFTTLYLAVVAQNPRGRAFWERCGFSEVHRKVCRVGDLDCEVARMVKRLG
ncbi:MAG: GNAT family N-acetyltransferase [Anaeromyxobacter sp.]